MHGRGAGGRPGRGALRQEFARDTVIIRDRRGRPNGLLRLASPKLLEEFLVAILIGLKPADIVSRQPFLHLGMLCALTAGAPSTRQLVCCSVRTSLGSGLAWMALSSGRPPTATFSGDSRGLGSGRARLLSLIFGVLARFSSPWLPEILASSSRMACRAAGWSLSLASNSSDCISEPLRDALLISLNVNVRTPWSGEAVSSVGMLVC